MPGRRLLIMDPALLLFFPGAALLIIGSVAPERIVLRVARTFGAANPSSSFDVAHETVRG